MFFFVARHMNLAKYLCAMVLSLRYHHFWTSDCTVHRTKQCWKTGDRVGIFCLQGLGLLLLGVKFAAARDNFAAASAVKIIFYFGLIVFLSYNHLD